jgi:hypothetical protein
MKIIYDNKVHIKLQIGSHVSKGAFIFLIRLTTPLILVNSHNRFHNEKKSTATTIGVLGFDSRRGLGIFLFTTVSRTALGLTQPSIQGLFSWG